MALMALMTLMARLYEPRRVRCLLWTHSDDSPTAIVALSQPGDLQYRQRP